MTKSQALKRIDYTSLMESLLTKEQIQKVQQDVKVFMHRNHGLPMGVLNVILIRSIILTDGDFNEVYLRKVAETFKAYEITTVELAIEYLDKNHENNKQIQRRGVPEPDWMDEYVQNLKEIKPVNA